MQPQSVQDKFLMVWVELKVLSQSLDDFIFIEFLNTDLLHR